MGTKEKLLALFEADKGKFFPERSLPPGLLFPGLQCGKL